MQIIVAGFCIPKDKSPVISLVWSHTNKSRPILRPKFVNKVEIDHKIELSRAVIIYRLVCDQGHTLKSHFINFVGLFVTTA